MPMNAKRLGKAFAVGAVLLFVIVVGFYSYARYRVHRAISNIPARLGVDIKQSTAGFSFSKSEGGRTLFSITAGKAVQYKQGERAVLSDVRIIVFARANPASGNQSKEQNKNVNSEHYDQIFGKEFEYDPHSGDVTASGEVRIDLEGTGKPAPTIEAEKETPGMIHLRTSGLTFNQKTGIAQTSQPVDFAVPQASGSALGARYDTKLMALTLLKDVKIKTASGMEKSSSFSLKGATIFAESGVIADDPRQALLTAVRVEETNHKFSADALTIALRPDNTVSTVHAAGNVRSTSTGKSSTEVRATSADAAFGHDNLLASMVLSGQVSLHESGVSSVDGSAGLVEISFVGKNEIQKIRSTQHVSFIQQPARDRGQPGAASQATHLTAAGVDLFFVSGNHLQRAETQGPAQLELNSIAPASQTTAGHVQPPLTHTIITAGKFAASFGAQNRMKSLFGSPNARIVSSTPGLPDRVSTSRDFTAIFDPARNGTFQRITQRGAVHYSDGSRNAWGESADYTPADQTVALSGSPRVQDKDAGLTISAQKIKLNQSGQGATADGEVKTTYDSAKRKNSNGAILSSRGGDPVHVTGDAMTYAKPTGIARYAGHARLWQGGDVLQAPTIIFDQNNSTLLASGGDSVNQSPNTSNQPVKLSFAKMDKSGKVTPVTVVGSRLTYSDNDRLVRLDGPVEMRMPDATMSARHLEVYLRPKNSATSSANDSSQIDHAIVRQEVLIEQKNPARKATGDTLVYTAAEEKFVLTGTSAKPPSIFDAERGNVTGNSLTFYNRDDRVQVGGSDSSRTVTRTTIKSESKP